MVSNYEKLPKVNLRAQAGACAVGWQDILASLGQATAGAAARRLVLVVECYPGVDEQELMEGISGLCPVAVIRSREAFADPAEIDVRVAPFLGGDDPVFGWLTSLRVADFMDPEKLAALRQRVAAVSSGLVLVVGTGAALIHPGDVLVYADLARREAQLRMRRDEISNLGVENRELRWSLQYKRAFFIDWRVCDRLKRDTMARWDFVLDTNRRSDPCMAEGPVVREALASLTRRPFRVVPFFDPAPWGGQWLKEVCDLDRDETNFGWGFDCVPEENSLLLDFGTAMMEIPSINLVFQEPRGLLGEKVHARFGDEFPIRFDFLDTIGGGHLSFQVHPLTEYIQQHFGMAYTQDESYYILDATADAVVYLGLKEGVDREGMAAELRAAQRGEIPFEADRHANVLPARKHDHFLIPAGTCHCSGAGSMVLEISATPYIFTFKMWDWGRLGLDGFPRPIHVERGLANIDWERDTRYVREQLVNRVEPVAAGDGWREERTGLHQREFIETRRHWFTGAVAHDTSGGVNVLNLIEGREAVVESPGGAFEPFVVHYAETFIVPADVGPYTIRPHGESIGRECATIKAYVRA